MLHLRLLRLETQPRVFASGVENTCRVWRGQTSWGLGLGLGIPAVVHHRQPLLVVLQGTSHLCLLATNDGRVFQIVVKVQLACDSPGLSVMLAQDIGSLHVCLGCHKGK